MKKTNRQRQKEAEMPTKGARHRDTDRKRHSDTEKDSREGIHVVEDESLEAELVEHQGLYISRQIRRYDTG